MTEPTSTPMNGADHSAKIDTTTPQTARVWNYWLGGIDNYPVDRELGDAVAAEYPVITALARAARAGLARAIRYLAGEAGIRQFLDVGTGLPTANNTHEVAQSVAPDSRIVYVDNDPLVLVHAQALLTSNRQGATDYVDADLRDADTIMRQAARTLDLDRPVGLILSGVLAHLPTYEEAREVVRRLLARLSSGSYLYVSDGTNTSPAVNDVIKIWNASARPPYELRSPAQVAGYFDGLELVEPGVVPIPQWRPDPSGSDPETEAVTDNYVGVGRKP